MDATIPKTRPALRWLIATILVLCVVQVVWIASTWDGMGYTKDEGYYFSASKDNFGWYQFLVTTTFAGHPTQAFTQRNIDRYWKNNHEHPPFCKAVQGFHHQVFNEWTGLLNYGNSHRAATLSWSLLLIVFLVLLTTEWLSTGWAIGVVLLLFTLPRVFFHTHINTFDIPVVAMWFVTAYAFRRGMENKRWAWVTGVLLGVGLATKNNAYFLPVLFFIMYVASPYLGRLLRSIKNLPGTIRKANKFKLLAIISLALAPFAVWIWAFDWLALTILLDLATINLWLVWIYWIRPRQLAAHIVPILAPMFTAPLVFIMLWPWIWVDTWPRLATYFNRHLHPPAWETYYLHQIVVNPPPFDWHYPFVMSWYTIPITMIVAFLIGLAILLQRGHLAGFVSKFMGKGAPCDPLLSRYTRKQETPVLSRNWDQLFLLMNILLPFLIIANPKTPIYGGTKHYMTAMPFFAIVVAVALRWISWHLTRRWAPNRLKQAFAAVILTVLIAIPGAVGIRHTHPYTLSYYNELMGGTIAAAEVGMQRTFWAQTTSGVLEHLNRYAPKNAIIYFNNTPWTSIRAYQEDGLLRRDIRPARRGQNPDYAVMNHWKFYTDRTPESIYHLRQQLGADYAEAWAGIDGLPLTEVFRNVAKIGPSPKTD